MKRFASLLPLLMLAVTFIVHSCSQEAVLSKEDDANLFALRDSTGNDSTDTIPGDTIPTIPTHDSIWNNIAGLNIVPGSVEDSAVYLDITSTNFFPSSTSTLVVYSNSTDSSWNFEVAKAYPDHFATPGSSQARKVIWHLPFTNGTRPFTITLGGQTFAGTLNANSSHYTIGWSHDSVITIQPKTFPR